MSASGAELARYLRTLAAGRANDACTDRQLLEQFVSQREQASFAALVWRHGPMVLNVCRRVLGQDQDAEDAFQATFLVLAKKAGTIRKQDSVSSWLHGVAYRIAEKLRAREARRVVHERKSASRPAIDPTEDVAWREIRCLLDSELARLPEQYRGPLVLCYLQGKTQDEAARQLGWSLRTFRRRLKCARELLIRRLKRRGITLSAALTAPLLIDGAASAALPPLLIASTVRAGLASATGQAIGPLVSEQVATLAEGGVSSLLVKKASIALVVLMFVVLGVGGLLAYRAASNRTLAEAPPAPDPQSPPARSASKDPSTEIKGRVLDPEGKPLAGAKVYVSTYSYKDKSDPKLRAETDESGRFHFTARPVEVEDREMMVAAVAPGYGPDWAPLSEPGERTLRLVKDDVPIKGRVLDLEGRPIAGTTVRILRLWKLPSEALTGGIKELQADPKERFAFSKIHAKYDRVLSSVWGVLGTPSSTKSGADGQFQLRGLGRDRIAEIRIEGPSIEYRFLNVILRPGLANGLPPDIVGPTFDHLAAPSKPIRGTVREKETGKPIAGIRVGCQAAGGEYGSEAFTDKQGHYQVPGIRKSEQYLLNVGYRNPPYINYSKNAGDTPGLEPVTMDFEMERGLVLRIRVTEKGSGKPVRGLVQYGLRSDNKELGRYTTYPRNAVSWDANDKDGAYEQIVLPGPGYIAFRATAEQYARLRLKEQKDDLLLSNILPAPLTLGNFHAVVPVNPSAKDAQSLICDIALDRGRALSGTVADPEGRPLPGAMAWGINAVMNLDVTRQEYAWLATPTFTVTGLDSRYPRTLIFYHAEKKLAKALLIRGDEKGPLTVSLQPWGTFTGRVVDASGKPRPGITVTLSFEEKQARTLPEEQVFANSSLHQVLLNNRATTDKDGRFRMEGLVTGLKYDLNIARGEQYFGRVVKDVAGKPGETVDLGEIKMQAPSAKK
jgi:RNA polymerase sigma factor (sigma-70 family)